MKHCRAESAWFQWTILFFLLLCSDHLRAEKLPQQRPALIGFGPRSLVNLIDTERLYRKGQRDAWVMFNCSVSPDGAVFPSEFFTFSPESNLLKEEVLRKLRLSKFIPAVYNHRRTYAYVGGTVIFVVVNGQPRLRVYAHRELDEIKKGSDFIAPQFVDIPGKPYPADWPRYPSGPLYRGVGGSVTLRHSVDATGKTTGVQVMSESQPGYRFAEYAEKALPLYDFLPAYRNGQPTAATYTLYFRFGRPRR